MIRATSQRRERQGGRLSADLTASDVVYPQSQYSIRSEVFACIEGHLWECNENSSRRLRRRQTVEGYQGAIGRFCIWKPLGAPTHENVMLAWVDQGYTS